MNESVSVAGSLAQTALALGMVLAAIFAVAWLLRRTQGLRAGRAGVLQVHAGVQVGSRERVVWLQAGDTHLLLGVAPGRVQTLHSFAEPPTGLPPPQAAPPRFAELLKRVADRGRGNDGGA
jgi:flagellar protein FliO/FliZ